MSQTLPRDGIKELICFALWGKFRPRSQISNKCSYLGHTISVLSELGTRNKPLRDGKSPRTAYEPALVAIPHLARIQLRVKELREIVKG